MRTSLDVLRSLKRIIALALPGYEVLFDGEEGVAERPMAVVSSVTPPNVASGSPYFALDMVEGFDAYVYPEAGANVQDSRIKAGQVQEVLVQALGAGVIGGERADGGIGRPHLIAIYDFEEKTWKQGVTGYAQTRLDGAVTLPQSEIGVLDADGFTQKGLLYIGGEVVTYTGKTETSLTGVAGGTGQFPDNTLVRQYGDRLAPDYARVLDLSVDVKQSPSDQKLYTVLAEVRLGWRRGSLLPSNAEMADSVRIRFE